MAAPAIQQHTDDPDDLQRPPSKDVAPASTAPVPGYSTAYGEGYKNALTTPGLTTPGVPTSETSTPGYDFPGGWFEGARGTAAKVTTAPGGQALGQTTDTLSGHNSNNPGQRGGIDSAHDVTGVSALPTSDRDSGTYPAAAEDKDAQPTIIDTIAESLSLIHLPSFLVGESHPAPPVQGEGPTTDQPAEKRAIRPKLDRETSDAPGFAPNMPGSLVAMSAGAGAVTAGEMYARGTQAEPATVDASTAAMHDQPWQAAPFMNVGSDQTGTLSGTDMFPESSPTPSAQPTAPPGTQAGPTLLDKYASTFKAPGSTVRPTEEDIPPALGKDDEGLKDHLPALAARGVLGAGAAGVWENKKLREAGTTVPASSATAQPAPAPSTAPQPTVARSDAARARTDGILSTQPKKTPPGQPIVQPLSEKHAGTFDSLQTGTQMPTDVRSTQEPAAATAAAEEPASKSHSSELPALAAGGILGAGAAETWEHANQREAQTSIPAPTAGAAGPVSTTTAKPSTADLLGAPPKQMPAGQPIVQPLSEKHADTFNNLSTSTQMPKTASQLLQPTTADLLGASPKRTPAGQPIVQPLSEKHAETFNNLSTQTQLPKSAVKERSTGVRDELPALAAGGVLGAASADLMGAPSKKTPGGTAQTTDTAAVTGAGIGTSQLSSEDVKKNRELAAAAGLATPAGEQGPLGSTTASERQRKIEEATARASAGGHPGVLSESERLSRTAAMGAVAHEPSFVDSHGRRQTLETAAGAGAVGAATTGAVPAAEKMRADQTAPALGQPVLGGSSAPQHAQPAQATPKAQPGTDDQTRQRRIAEAEAFAGGAAGAGAMTEAERLRQNYRAADQSRAPAPLPTVAEVDTPRDERGNALSYGTATILTSPGQGDAVDDQLQAAGAHTHEAPVPEGTAMGPYGTGQHEHKETVLEEQVQGEDEKPLPDTPARDTNNHRVAAAALAGGAIAGVGAAVWDKKVGGGSVYGSGNDQAHNTGQFVGVQRPFAPSTGATYGGSTFGGPDYPSKEEDVPAGDNQAQQGPLYHYGQSPRQGVTFNESQHDENEPIATGEHQRQRSVLRKKPSKKMQERPKKLPEEEKQRRRSLSAEPVAAAGIPEKRRRGSIDEKERRQHKKLHKKRRSIETGVFAGPDGGPGQIGVPVDYENESSPEEGHAQDNTEEEITSPQATRLTPENQAQDAHEPHIEHPPQATYGASGWAPAVVEAQRSAQAQEGGEPRKGGQSQAQAKGAPYGTDWRTADVPGGARTAEKRNSGSGTLNSPGSPVSPRKRTPSLLRRMRGEAKVVSGRLAMDTGKMEQGRLMKEGYVGGEYNPEPAE